MKSSPGIGPDGTIYIGSGGGRVYAINPNGTTKWRFRTGDTVSSSPAIGRDGTIYIGSQDGSVYALNPDGTVKWSYKTGNAVLSSPAIARDGTVYIGSYDGKIYAFGLSDTGNTIALLIVFCCSAIMYSYR